MLYIVGDLIPKENSNTLLLFIVRRSALSVLVQRVSFSLSMHRHFADMNFEGSMKSP
jgi:hypothetical protein